MDLKKMVVVGGVAAGLSAASAVKRGKPDVEVHVYERSPHISFASCGLPYFVSGVVRKRPQIFTKETFTEQRHIPVFTRHEVTKIDPGKRVVVVRNLENGEEFEDNFDILVISTGARPKIPPVPGIDLQGVHVVRTLEDGIRMRERVLADSPKHGVVVGGGYIGCEMAEALSVAGMDVRVIQRSDHFLGTINPEIGAKIGEEFEKRGVKAHLNTTLKEVKGDGAGHVASVVTGDGEYPADFVIISIGIQPEADLAREAGIVVGKTGAIAVNEHQQTNIPYIYAAGDCCEAFNHAKGDWDYFPLGTTANKQGRVVGQHVLNGTATFGGIVGTAVTKIFELGVARTGLSKLECERKGLDFFTSTITHKSRADYYPGGEEITVSLNIERGTGRLLGAAMAGYEGVAKRIDVLATAIQAGMTVGDVQKLDLSYAPPFAPVWDPILVAANVASKKVGRK
ncbi:MAG: FAD-dependent oxidoreductase [Promethearchaeota archaeon]